MLLDGFCLLFAWVIPDTMIMFVSLELFNCDLWFHLVSVMLKQSDSPQSQPTCFSLCCLLLNIDVADFVVVAEKENGE